jgi:Right handed beta helix region/Dictyostelium (slime mold) repeat
MCSARLAVFVAALGLLAGATRAAAQGVCPGTATVTVWADNLSAGTTVTMALDGELLDPTATCDGTGAETYHETLECHGKGRVACGQVTGLRPGAWVNRLAVTVDGSAAQVQAARRVFVATAANASVWTVYARTFVVAAAAQADLRAVLEAAAAYADATGGPALVTFSRDAFPGAGKPRTIDLSRDTCAPDPSRAAALCFAGSRVVVDALDDRGEPGGVILSVGTRALSVLRLYGSDDVFRGLVLAGSTNPGLVNQADTLVITGPAAQRNRFERTIVHGPAVGDALSTDGGAAANLVDACELTGAQKKGVNVTNGAEIVIRRSCIHDNRDGGIQAALGGRAVALENVVQHNVPGRAGHGISAMGRAGGPSGVATDGNLVRFAGGRGLSVVDDAEAVFQNDYVADNQFAGAKVETTPLGPEGSRPSATFHGVAFVCNHNAGVTGSCQPQTDDEGFPCTTDLDCCGSAGDCCVADAGCAAPLHCAAQSFPRGLGVAQTQADGREAPDVSYGDASGSGRNAFAWNRNAPLGANLFVNAPGQAVPALGNQWEHCGTGVACDVAAVLDDETGDVRRSDGTEVDIGAPPGPRAAPPVLAGISPARPRAGELVRVFGDGFNAVEGSACAGEIAPADPCSGDNPAVQQANQAMNANRIRLVGPGGSVLATLYPDAVTPTMLAFRMPFDCFAPLVLQVSKRSPSGGRLTTRTTICDPHGCAGLPTGIPCDDGSACTRDDQCTGGEAGVCQGTPVDCDGECLTGTCDPQHGCVPKPATAGCDDGNACTVGDRCSGTGDVCVPGGPRVCTGACLTGSCDPVQGCKPRPPTAVCRPSAGTCDVAELCDGVGKDCPPNALLPAATMCRAAAGPCDVPEACTGASAACPRDGFAPSTTECRPAARVCDLAESCTGTGPACPADAKSRALCRPRAGDCDLAERCDGVGDECPPDAFRSAGAVCRPAAGTCDAAETCSGHGPACAADGFRPASAACNDGNACTVGDHCGGDENLCLPGDAVGCDDGDPCTADLCDPLTGCLHRPPEGLGALRCGVSRCERPRLRRRLTTIVDHVAQLTSPSTGTSRARALRRLRHALRRCGVVVSTGV